MKMKKYVRSLCSILVLSIIFNMFALSAFAAEISTITIADKKMNNYVEMTHEVNDLIQAGGTYSDLIDYYLNKGVVTQSDINKIIVHDSKQLAQRGETLDSPIISNMPLLSSSEEEYKTYKIPYDALFYGTIGVAALATRMAGHIGIAATLLIAAATFAYNLWKANQDFDGIIVEVKWVYYWDDNSLSYRNQPFVMDYYAY